MNAAITDYERVLTADPGNVEALTELGEVYLGMGLAGEAERFFLRARASGPAQGALRGLAVARFELQRWEEARRDWEAILRESPGDPDALGYLGEIALTLGELDRAEGYYRRLLEVQPGSEEALTNLGAISMRRGQDGEAERLFWRALTMNPASIVALISLGQLHARGGRLHDAIVELNRAVALEPQSPITHKALGVLYYEQGIFSEAIPAFEEVLFHDPTDRGVRIALAISYHAIGERTLALKEAEVLAKNGAEGDPALLLLLAALHLEQGNNDAAIAAAQELLAREPENSDGRYLLALAYLRKGMLEAAREAIGEPAGDDSDTASAAGARR